MPTTKRVFSYAPWEQKVGYCRAIQRGPFVAVTGTASVDDEGQVFGVGDPHAQAQRCLAIIETALLELGLTRNDVIRTRMFVTDISKWEAFGSAHREFFAGSVPATTMVEVRRLISPEMLIEIEADAIASEEI